MRTPIPVFDPRLAAMVLVAVGLGCSGADRAGKDDAALAVPAALADIPASGPDAIRRARLLEPNAELDLRDAPLQFRAELERNSGRFDTIDVPVAAVDDTSIVRIVEGKVQAQDVGGSGLRFVLTPALRLRGSVVVTERIAADSVWLSNGEVRGWELRPGFYRITVDAKAEPGKPQPMELAADLLCAPDSRGPKESISCRVRQNTRLLMRHTGAGGVNGPSLAVVTIVRLLRS